MNTGVVIVILLIILDGLMLRRYKKVTGLSDSNSQTFLNIF